MPERSPFTQLCQRLAQLRAEAHRADLHIHTCHSDGVFTPAEVVRRARQRGLGAIAITDHDTVAGYEPALVAVIAGEGIALEIITGVEITCEFAGRELHLLGYFFQPDDPVLAAALAELQEARRSRFAEMIDRLPAHVRPEAGGVAVAAPSRRSLAQLLLQQGKVRTIGEAFARFLRDGSPACVPKRRLDVAHAIALVRGAGGVTSWAHPPQDVTYERILELRELGLGAVEAIYPTFRSARTRQLREFAARAGLAVTGGSDCHGPAPASRGIGNWGISWKELAQLRQVISDQSSVISKSISNHLTGSFTAETSDQ